MLMEQKKMKENRYFEFRERSFCIRRMTKDKGQMVVKTMKTAMEKETM